MSVVTKVDEDIKQAKENVAKAIKLLSSAVGESYGWDNLTATYQDKVVTSIASLLFINREL